MKKVAVVIADLFEDVEYASPANALKAEGHKVITIGHEQGETVIGKQKQTQIKVDKGIDQVKAADFDALFIPGGFSPDILRADQRFVAFAKAFMDDKKPVFAICHGPQLLIAAKAIEGRKATGYTSIKVDMEYAKAIYLDQEVVVDQGQLVTSRTPDDLEAFNRESLKLLKK
ncbi:type 1 glutamine amidotransferase domain-containing protein [Amphibacillus cookii]|uniref:type 1 glutamine amidotransferase domain-containing protein n=1 Tax=Amphibacillus cookii TaxID=767787 RepID=UPI001959C336|nr:type 1 glutamine amidotransferase domain-containing protein [Amphibacillus cookii]MBM7541386.1 protease I [Amphibacillus cookii]